MDAFNPFADVRPGRNPPAPQPPRPFGFGPNPFNQANRAERFADRGEPGINPPFVFNPEPRGPAWNLRGNGQWGMNFAPRVPNRAAAYPEDRAYMQFQARAFGLPAPAPAPIPGPAPPAPPAAPPAAPAPPPPAAEGQGQQAAAPEMPLGRNENAGTGGDIEVPPLLVCFNEWRALANMVCTALAELVVPTRAIARAACGLAMPLANFVVQWVVFFFVVTLALQVSLPALIRVVDGMSRRVILLLPRDLLDVSAWLFKLGIGMPRKSTSATYVLRRVWISRAVTGLPYGASSAVGSRESIPGPPYGSTALTSGFSLLYSLSLDPTSIIWSVFLTLVIAPAVALFCAVVAGILLGL